MAIRLVDQYPGKTAGVAPGYPQGKARNVSTPGDGTGTPWEAAIVNDDQGFKQALLKAAGINPSGAPDTADVSQYLTALQNLFAASGGVVAGSNFFKIRVNATDFLTVQWGSSAVNGGALATVALQIPLKSAPTFLSIHQISFERGIIESMVTQYGPPTASNFTVASRHVGDGGGAQQYYNFNWMAIGVSS